MKKLWTLLTLFIVTISTTMAQGLTKVDVSIFPAPEKGYKQVVIEVPHSDQDDNKKIEFFIGKMMEVDGCNSYNLMGKLEKKDLQGWGYDYYVFESKGDAFSTRKGCGDMPKRNMFVSSQPELARYNGKMPIVIYVPEDMQVKFKIFTSGKETFTASEIVQKKK